MMKNVLYALSFSICITASTAVAESSNKGPLILSTAQMDYVTAGTSADVIVNADANSDFFALTSTFGSATATQSGADNPALRSYIGIAGGSASAVAIGEGSSTDTDVTPTADVPGTNIQVHEINIHSKVLGVEINAASVVKVGSFTSPLPTNLPGY
ncbi:hypothetical protein Nhal_0138 [Nitrosococcus halophilus Nc 4]|uniref:Uncharacterized protein n=1 Tax=Nitrosococcus halophilus (strain Nc4) TaxID=472759 RepID=D5C4T2_NITHN|nr:hypothetical protein [Nitrosococcus halophilus]ADE13355.1 hypothetical protein Nhal_0138 [Nitrosococcus halophilus Nc 4]